MLGLVLTTLVFAFISALCSFAVFLRTLLPVVLGPSRRGAYGANPQKTFAAPRSSSAASLSSRRRSDGPQAPPSVVDVQGPGPNRLRSAQRVQAWLAVFDIVSLAFLISYWVAVATSQRSSWTYPPSPLLDGRTSALLVVAVSLRPITLTVVSAMSFVHIRLGRSSYLGRVDWRLWATASLLSSCLSFSVWLVFHGLPRDTASTAATALIFGLSTALVVICTAALLGLMWTIYQAKTIFQVAMLAGRTYGHSVQSLSISRIGKGSVPIPLDAVKLSSTTTVAQPPEEPPAKIGGEYITSQPTEDAHAPVPPVKVDPVLQVPPTEANNNLIVGTVTTATGGTLSVVAGSAVPSSADPYHIAPTMSAPEHKDTVSTSHIQSSRSAGAVALLTPTAAEGDNHQGVVARARLHSSTSAASETQGLVEDGAQALRGRTTSPPGNQSKSRKSLRTLRDVLDDMSRSGQGVNINDWRHSLSQPHLARSDQSDDDATTLQSPSPRQSSQPLTVSGAAEAPTNATLSPDRIRQEVEEQVDRMFAEVGLNVIKDRWREIVPTGSLPIVRSPSALALGSHLCDEQIDPARLRASTYAQLQTAAFSTRPEAAMPAIPQDELSYIPHTYDPNFDGTFSQSITTGDNSRPSQTQSNFSVTGVRRVGVNVAGSGTHHEGWASPSQAHLSEEPLPASREGTFGAQSPDPHVAVNVEQELPTNAARVSLRPRQAHAIRDTFTASDSKLRQPYFDPTLLMPTAHQLDYINVPAPSTLPFLGRGAASSLGRLPHIRPSDAASELVQAVQGGGDDILGAHSALVRIASHATLKMAVQRVEFDLTNEQNRLSKESQAGRREGMAVSAGAVAYQYQRLYALKQAQKQEEGLKDRETRIAFLRLTSHLLGLWIPYVFSLPYLLFALVHPRAASAPLALPLLMSISLTLYGPLALLQTLMTHGSGLQELSTMANAQNPLYANSSQAGYPSPRPDSHARMSSERTLMGSRRPSEAETRLDNFAVRIEKAASAGVNKPVGSVPYQRQHWVAGEVVGDRVTRPRSAILRGLSLLFETRPRLEVLPFQAEPENSPRRIRPANALLPSEVDGCSWAYESNEDIAMRAVQGRPPQQHPHRHGVRPSRGTNGLPLPPRSRNGTSNSGPGHYQLDGLSAMLLPRLVPGLSIGPDVLVADDDERTLVEEYQSFYRRYLSDLPDIFNLSSARQAFQDARRSVLSRLNIRQNPDRTPVASRFEAANVSTPNATGGSAVVGDDSMLSFTTAAEPSIAGEAGAPLAAVGPREAEISSASMGESRDAKQNSPVTDHTRAPFEFTPQPAKPSPPRLPFARSSSIDIDAGKALPGHPNVTTRSRHSRHRRGTASLPLAEVEAPTQDVKDNVKDNPDLPASASERTGLARQATKEPQASSPSSPSPDTSVALSVANEGSHRRSLASELGLTSARKSLGSDMGIESVGSGRQRKSLSSDFGLLLAALQEQKEESPSSSKRLTCDSVSSTTMSEVISLSTPSKHGHSSPHNNVKHSSPPPHGPAAKALADTTLPDAIIEESNDVALEEPSDAAVADNAEDEAVPDKDAAAEAAIDAEIASVVQQMDPLTLHRYLHPAIPLETLDEVTEEMTADLTRSLDAIWMRSQRDSFLSMRRNAFAGTPRKLSFDDALSELGIDTPRSAVGQYGYAWVARKNGIEDIPLGKLSSGSNRMSDGPAMDIHERLDALAFDSSVWASSGPLPFTFQDFAGPTAPARLRPGSATTTSTIGFEKEAEWVDNTDVPSPKKGKSKGKTKAKQRRSHSHQSEHSMIKRTSFKSSISDSSNQSGETSTRITDANIQTVPESPWAMVSKRKADGPADYTITSPPRPLTGLSDRQSSVVNEHISRFERLAQPEWTTPAKEGRVRKKSSGRGERAALRDKTNGPVEPISSGALEVGMDTPGVIVRHWAFPNTVHPHHSSSSVSSATSAASPQKRTSFPPAHGRDQDQHGQDENGPAAHMTTSSLGRKSSRTSASIPAIHVRGPSDSSALSFYHF